MPIKGTYSTVHTLLQLLACSLARPCCSVHAVGTYQSTVQQSIIFFFLFYARSSIHPEHQKQADADADAREASHSTLWHAAEAHFAVVNRLPGPSGTPMSPFGSTLHISANYPGKPLTTPAADYRRPALLTRCSPRDVFSSTAVRRTIITSLF